MAQVSPSASFEVILQCAEGNTSLTADAQTLVQIFDSLVGVMGATNIFEPNPFVSATFIVGPCDGVSLIAFQFYYDAVCPHIALLGEAPPLCCETLSSSSSSSSVPVTGQRLLQIGQPTRVPKLIVAVADLTSAPTLLSSSSSSSSSSASVIETIDMIISPGEGDIVAAVPYVDINNVPLWQVGIANSASFIGSDGSHNSSAQNVYLISDNALSALLLSGSQVQFFDPGLSNVGTMGLPTSDVRALANRVGGWTTSMGSMWPGSVYSLQGNIAAPIRVSSGGSMLYWSQIHGSTRASAYSNLRSQLFEINRNASSYSVLYSSPVDYDNPVVLGKTRNALDIAGAREHVEIHASLLFDIFEMIGSKECRVAINPILGYGVQMSDGDPISFYIDAGINGIPIAECRGIGYTSLGDVPHLISPSQVSEIASVFRNLGLPLRMQFSLNRYNWIFAATRGEIIIDIPTDIPPSDPRYQELLRLTKLFMRQRLARYFFRNLLGEPGDPADTPPSGWTTWRDEDLQQRLFDVMDDLAVQYLQAVRGI